MTMLVNPLHIEADEMSKSRSSIIFEVNVKYICFTR